MLGVAKSVVSYYEQGDRCPSQDVLIRIASVFHTSTDYLLGLEKKRTLDVSDLDDEDVKVLENVVTIRSTVKEDTREALSALADAMIAEV